MEDDKMDEDIKKELKYRLVLARYNEDDPVLEAHLLRRLLEVYKKHGVKVSEKMKDHIKEESERIKVELTKEYKKKAAEYNARISGTYQEPQPQPAQQAPQPSQQPQTNKEEKGQGQQDKQPKISVEKAKGQKPKTQEKKPEESQTKSNGRPKIFTKEDIEHFHG